MIEVRNDVKKIQILKESDESEVHYIERSGSHYVYTFLSAHGEGVVHQVSPENLDTFIKDLYTGFVNHKQSLGQSVVIDIDKDINDIKKELNV